MNNKFIGPTEIINKKEKYLCPPSFIQFYKNPPQIVKGEMQYLYDTKNNKYLDLFAGVSVMNCGHSNPYILEKTIEQMQQLQHTSIIYLTEPIVTLAEKLSKVLPGNLSRSFFCCTGSEANETALLVARLHTGKNGFISLQNSLHGRTHMTSSVTAIPMWRSDPKPMEDVHFVNTTWSYNEDINITAQKSLDEIENVINNVGKENIAGLIIEPIQGNGGIITPPKDYFKKLKSILEKNDILLIVDEVQTGFGRTGKMFAIEHFDITPDIMTVAKALGNGMPISAMCTNDLIAKSFNKPSASTLGGNPVCSTTAIAVLNYIENHNLCNNAKVLGDLLKSELLKLKEKYDIIVDVRGIGLMQGIELRDKDGNPLFNLVDDILEYMKDNGIIVGKNGLNRNVIAIQPPLVITADDIHLFINTLNKCLSELV